MNRMVIAASVAGLGYLGFKKFKGPTKDDFQSTNSIGPNGVPVKIATPVSNVITTAQATGTSGKKPTKGKVAPTPTTVSGKGVTYAPPGTITPGPGGEGVLQPAPIIVTPAGAASIAVGSVKDVQHALNTLGFCKPALKEDGKLGPVTIAAIKTFQQANKLTVDGNAGPATNAALSAALTRMAGAGSAAGATAQNSSPETGVATTPNGTVVNTTPALTMTTINVQRLLNVCGATPRLTEDGKIGPKTVAAIKSFQTANGLTPDGIAGAKTKTTLYLASMEASRTR